MRNLRGAIVGYGFIAEKGHAPAYRATERAGLGLEIVAIADGCPARRPGYPVLNPERGVCRVRPGL